MDVRGWRGRKKKRWGGGTPRKQDGGVNQKGLILLHNKWFLPPDIGLCLGGNKHAWDALNLSHNTKHHFKTETNQFLVSELEVESRSSLKLVAKCLKHLVRGSETVSRPLQLCAEHFLRHTCFSNFCRSLMWSSWCRPDSLCIYAEVLILRTRNCEMEKPDLFSFRELLPWSLFWLNKHAGFWK